MTLILHLGIIAPIDYSKEIISARWFKMIPRKIFENNTNTQRFWLSTINWDSLSTPHLSNHCASEFLAATQDAFLFQYVQSPTHTRPNQKPTLIDLIFSQDDQIITNMTTSALLALGKSHHKVLRFHYTADSNSKYERPHYLYHIALTMTVWNSSYKELIGMKCFIILALLNVGENLKKSLII